MDNPTPGAVGHADGAVVKHDELIAQLEAARGPDWELSRQIFEAIAMPTEWFGSKIEGIFRSARGTYGFNTADGGRHLECISAPSYTNSIDAALTLVRPAHEFEIGSAHLAECYWASIISARGEWRGKGKTAAIALCIAALKSHAAVGDHSPAPTGKTVA